jgi:hypothetical protein
LQLCREYSCAPLELDAQPLDVTLDHIACLQAEAKHAEFEQRRRKLKRR